MPASAPPLLARLRCQHHVHRRPPEGRISRGRISFNPAAMHLLGDPKSVTIVASGLDLIVVGGGVLNLEISVAGSGRLLLSQLSTRVVMIPGLYRLSRGRHRTMTGLIFQGVLLVECDVVLGSRGRYRAAEIRKNQS